MRARIGRPLQTRGHTHASLLIVALLAGLLGGCYSYHVASPPVLSRGEFIARYGLAAPPTRRPTQPTPATVLAQETATVFDERKTHAGYRYARSIVAIREMFRERGRRALSPSPPRSPRHVQLAIDQTFGVSQLGEGFRVIRSDPMPSSVVGQIQAIDFQFGNSGYGQAIVGIPARPNGVLLVAIHGCLGSPDAVMSDEERYTNGFGLRALERGYTVVAPYVLSQCGWIHNLDWIGQLSGVSVFGYELAKIGQLTTWAKRQYALNRAVVWGISLGGQYAMLSSALYRDVFDVTVISGAAADYERSYLEGVDAAGLDINNRIGANAQVTLSTWVARRDVVASILPRQIVFEVSTGDLRPDRPDIIAFINYVDEVARKNRTARPRVVLFEGTHETNPEATLDVIDELAGTRRPS